MRSVAPLGRRVVRPLSIVLVAFVGSAGALRAQAKETFTPWHVAKLQTVVSAKISPDGSRIAYLVSVPRDLKKEKDGPAKTHLYVVDTNGNRRGYVTTESVSAIDWTPDGRHISFLAKRAGDKERALYAIPVDGGEARKLFEHTTSIQAYSWSPDGKRVAFLATAPLSKKQKELKEKGFSQEIYEEDVPPVHVWVALIGASTPAKKLPIRGSVWNVEWSPAGDALAIAVSPLPLIDHFYMFRKVRVVSPDDGKVLKRLDIPGKMGAMAWSPDGTKLALIAGETKHDPREGRLWVTDVRHGGWYDVLPNYLGHVQDIGWLSNDVVGYVGHEGCWSSLGTVRIANRDGKIVALGKRIVVPNGGPILRQMSVAAKGTSIALVADAPRHPAEVYLLAAMEKPRRLTNHNPWLESMRFAKQEIVVHKARDGLRLEGILVRPLDEKEGKRYPLVLTVHGGPEAHISNGWVTRYAYLGQVGAANGFAVFYPNYRGSTGRGVKFSMLGQADAAGKEFDDLVDAVDHLVGIGLVDKSKVGITGGSYGGYATAWGATYYSERFAAGVMFVGISDGISKTGTTDIPWEMYLVHHRKFLWEDWGYFMRSSPIYHVKKARTPLLILHGKNDPRVHPGQSMELYRHLKIIGKGKIPVRLVFYPGEGHGNRRAASRLDYNLRLLRWMKHYLQGPGGPMPPREISYEHK